MQKFAKLLLNNSNVVEDFNIEEIFPLPVLGKLFSFSNLAKWAAYIDKYLVFPRRLEHALKQNAYNLGLTHTIDHSNSPYLRVIKNGTLATSLITCHDLIAIRTAEGDFNPAPQTSKTGKVLQSWIKNSLQFADYFTCDSNVTKKDLNRFFPHSRSISKVIHLGIQLDSEFLQSENIINSDLPFEPSTTRYILHVGSAAWYKNRKAVFRSFHYAKQQTNCDDLKLVVVGPPPQPHEIDPSVGKWLDQNSDDIIFCRNTSDQSLKILYENAELLIFPSHIEGYGWPPLEAASFACPVITTKTGAIHDLLGKKSKLH